MELRHLETFRNVLKHGSFRQAALAMGCSQSTVTLHIQRLEEDLGVRLFQRRGRRTIVTEAGDILRRRAADVLGSWDALNRCLAEFRDGGGGVLSLGAFEPVASLRLIPILTEFCRERPQLRIRIMNAGAQELSRQVAAGDLDLALSVAPPPTLSLSFEPLLPERLALLLPAGHPLAAEKIHASDLEPYQLILTEQGCHFRQTIMSAFLQTGSQVQWRFEVGSFRSIHEAVRLGMGIALVPESSALPPPPGTVLRRVHDLELALTVGIVHRREEAPPTRAAQDLLALLRVHPRLQPDRLAGSD